MQNYDPTDVHARKPTERLPARFADIQIHRQSKKECGRVGYKSTHTHAWLSF